MSRLILPILFALGCATSDRVQALEEKVGALEEKVAKLETQPAAAKGEPVVDEKAEEEAKSLYTTLNEQVGAGKMSEAQGTLSQLKNKYSSTSAYKRARKMEAELEVIGKTSPSDWNTKIEKWYQGEGKVDLNSGTTLVVFWEVWCPHCKREVPNLMETYTALNGKGLQVVGLTKITRSATEESVLEFMKEKEVNYPMAKENGGLSEAFNVSGIPAAAVVKDGKIIWRGHPARLNNELLTSWL